MGRDEKVEGFGVRISISIHAPAWGATLEALGDKYYNLISIHAPAWGATTAGDNIYFALDISIHAPAWGATPLRRGL